MRRVRLSLLCAAIALGACSRSPSTPRGGAGSGAASAASSASLAASASSERAPLPLPDGCWMEVDRDADAAALLMALRAACAPKARALIEGREIELRANQPAELGFDAPDGGACVRVLAASARELGDIELALLDQAGRTLAKDTLGARFALLGERGPVCVQAGRYKLSLGARGSGKARIDVLIATGDDDAAKSPAGDGG
jgi:hypothetical protein